MLFSKPLTFLSLDHREGGEVNPASEARLSVVSPMCNYSILFTDPDHMAAEFGVCSRDKYRDRKSEPAYAGSPDYL